jgi:hypothetical protein
MFIELSAALALMNRSRRSMSFQQHSFALLIVRFNKKSLQKYPHGQPAKSRDLSNYIGMILPDHIDLTETLADLQWVIENEANLAAFLKLGGANALADCLSV